MKEQFISWLEAEKPKSARHYTSGFNTIEQILSDNNLSPLTKWTLENYEVDISRLKSFASFENLNSSGNNILTATLSNYKKFMEQKDNINTPQLPFDSFGWRWASTGIASHLNKPKSLKIILDALLINGNGQDNYTKDFKNLVHKLCLNKYNISEEESDKLTKLSNPRDEKNIIENSANYWFHLGLIDSTGKNTTVSALGEKFLNGLLSNDEFVTNRIDEYFLPNKAYKNTEINKWESADLKIYPLKLIQDIFCHLFENYEKEQQYITESELSNIVIPCSYNIDKFDAENITNHIIEFRKEPNKYSSWPKPQSNYTDDKGLRMANEFLYFLEVFGFLSSNKSSIVKSIDKKYMATSKFIKMNESENEIKTTSLMKIKPGDFKIEQFKSATEKSGLTYSTELIIRYISSLATKPFVLLSGLSGSGKTKLAQSFAQWICEDKSQYCIVPVGADWTNREPLLGYVNALDNKEYILPENGALNLIIEANKEDNQSKPYFLILDEMNLSHVERYFADFLSVMESKDKFKLHSSKSNLNITDGDKEAASIEVPSTLNWPKNLFVVGTVNIDETTYMFSPKVLDRANAIEFKVNETEIEEFLDTPNEIDLTQLEFKGANTAASFIEIAKNKEFETIDTDSLNKTLVNFFAELKKTGAEFGYRTGMEIHRLYQQLSVINKKVSENDKIDIAVMQKLLPKLHGSRRKLCPILETLAKLCVKEGDAKKDFLENKDELIFKENATVIYPLSLEKITRMYKGAIDNGFASYAEA